MNDTPVYCMDRASESEIAAHLRECDQGFVPPLSGRVDIDDYSRKIFRNARRFEAWASDKLVALVASYCNAPDRNRAFITSVSVSPRWQGRGIASQLLVMCVDSIRGDGFLEVELMVGSTNEAAIALYEKHGFTPMTEIGPLLKMTMNPGKGRE